MVKMMRRSEFELSAEAEMVAVAARYVGLKERPTRSNLTPFGQAYGWNGVAWCMIMQRMVAVWAGQGTAVPKTASCAVAVAWFRERKRYVSRPSVGDLVFYGPRGGSHVELVAKVTGSHIFTIGGNTSGWDASGRINPEGDGVYYKPVPRNNTRIHGYAHPDYRGSRKVNPLDLEPVRGARPPYPGMVLRKGAKGPAVYAWQGRLLQLGFNVDMDGDLGAQTLAATHGFQSVAGLLVDGEVGPATWKAAFR